MIKLKPIKAQLIIFLVVFALFLSVKDKDALFLAAAFIASVSALVFDALFSYPQLKRISFSESAFISGLIIAFVLSSSERWWVLVLAAFCAISSKHLLQIAKKHIFNPASFGIMAMILLLGAKTQWKGTYAWYILVPAGFYFAYKIKKLSLLLSYFSAALGLFGIQAAIRKSPLQDIFWYLSYFFIFIMLIEPKTAPVKKGAQIIFGIGVAVLIFIFTEAGLRIDTEILSLLVFNLVFFFLGWHKERRVA